MFCPSTSVKNSELYKKHVEALGEPLTYLVYHKNDGNLLSEGKTADIYKQIFDKVQDEVLAIKLTSKVFGSNITIAKLTEEKAKPSRPSRLSRQSVKVTPKQIEVRPKEDQDLIDEASLDLNNMMLGSFVLLDNIQMEQDIVNSLTNTTLNILDELAASGQKRSLTKAYEMLLEDLQQEYEFFSYFGDNTPSEEDIESGAYPTSEENKIIANNIKLVLDNFNETKEGDKVKYVGFGFRITHEIGNMKFKATEEVENDTEELDKNYYADSWFLKQDPEKSLSAEVKRMLTFIPKKNSKGNPESNILGYGTFERYDKVFNYLQAELVNVPVTEMFSTLEKLAKENTIAEGVLDKLKELKVSDMSAYNKFHVVFRKQEALFKMLRSYPRDKDGRISYSVFDANRSGALSMVVDAWHESFKTKGLDTGLFTVDKETGQLNVNISKGKELKKEFDELVASKDNYDVKVKSLSELFNKIGLDVTIKQIKKINDERQSKAKYVKYKKYFEPAATFNEWLQNDISYIFNTLSGSLKEESIEEPWQNNNPFYTQSKRITGLAAYYAAANPNITSASFRNSNGDTVYGFVMPSHLSNRMQKIKDDKEYVARLQEVPFIQNSTWLTEDVEHSYFDASKNARSRQDAKSYNEQSPIEKEYTKLGLFQKAGKKAVFIGNTPSDKSTFPLFETERHNTQLGIDVFDNGVINGDAIDITSESFNRIYNLVVQSEVNRINAVMTAYNTLSQEKLIPGYHYMKTKDGKTIPGGGNYFFFVPELNKIASQYRDAEGKLTLGDEGNTALKQELAKFLTKLAKDKVQSWNSKGIVNFEEGKHSFDKSYAKSKLDEMNRDGKAQNLINYAAMDFVVNYMMSYANQFMVVTGDPALFTKSTYKFTDYEALIGNVSDNIFKRTAKDIAPGLEGLFDTQNYNVVFLNEPVEGSVMTEYKDRLGNLTGTYEKADIADAQEWTTLKEHINVMYAYGKLDATQRTRLIDKIQKRKDAPAEEKSKYNLTWDEIRDVLQPMKPVQVYSEIDKELRTDVQYYIKTSSFPLIPQLTEGFEIDKLREAMEEHNVDRAVVPSGVKTGFRNMTTIFDGNSITIKDNFVESITPLSREGFRIQQEVPHDYTKNKILEGSQLRKMKFANLTIDLDFNLYGTNYKGYELKKLDDQIHSRVYDLKFDALLKKLGVTDGVTITDVTKLRSLLVESAKDLGYGYNDQMLLNTITLESGKVIFDIPLFFHNNADKIESMLNSIIKNKVLKNKMSGLSFVQGSSAGFTSSVAGEEFLQEVMKTTKARIAFTKHYKGDKLDYREYEENGKKVIYGEVFAPFMFINTKPDGTKEPLRLEDYTDEQGFIREDKIDDNLLNLLGYRIPTQGHNSMIKLKIVGFLPQEAGDLIIVPGAITKQMGSDFDVDKLFTHFYNYNVSSKGITKIQPDLEKGAENLTEEELHNLSLDITYSILSNETVQNKYQFQSVDNPALAIDKEKIKSMKPGKKAEVNRAKPQNSSILYDEYQTHMVEVNAAGKVGIGSFSTASANHILFQYAGVAIVSPTDSKGRVIKDKEVSVMFKDDAGNIYSDKRSGDDYDNNRVKPAVDFVEFTPQGEKKTRSYYGYSPNQGAWRLDKVWTFENPITKQRKSISEVISYYQSASVDNAKDQHLFDLHLNNETFRVTSLIARAGFDEMFIDRFINQPIIVEYVKRLKDASNFTELEFDPNKAEKIQNQLFSEQGVKPSTLKVNAVSLAEMEEAIKDDGKNKVFQAQILYNFIKYADVAKEVARVQNAINVDTAFLGKSLYSSIVKRDMLSKSNFYLGNVSNLVDGTTQGAAIEYGLEGSLNLFSGNNLYPTQSPVISSVFTDISEELDTDISEDDAYKIMNDIRASLFALAHENTFKSDINETRRELLFGTEKKQSLAKRVFAVQSTTDNIFLRSLTINQSYTKEDPDVIEFGASKDIRKELDFAMFLGWNELLHSSDPNLKELGEDLVKYSFLTGNQRTARDFGRFLPYDYIITSGLNEFYRSIDFNTPNDITEKVLANFTTQWFQHNPFRAKQVERVMFDNATDFEGKKSSKNDIPDIITLKNQEQEGMADFYTDRNGDFKRPEFITLLDEKRTPYLYQDRNGVYSRIPVLGQGQLIKEYNVNEFANQSIFRPHVKDIRYNMVAIHKEESIQREPGNKVFAAYEFEKGHEAVLDNIISNSGNELNVAVAKFYKDNINTIKDIYRLEEFDPTKHYNATGAANPRGRTRAKEFVAINPSNNETAVKFEETFLHELTHAFLVEKLENKPNKELQDIIDSLGKHKDKLSDVEWLKQIGVERIDENGWVYKDYTFSKQGEFASFLMSNSDFQKILDNIESEQDKSLLQRIKEIIFKILGINIKDTKLAEGLSVVIGIIEGDNLEAAKGSTENTQDLIDGYKFSEKKPNNKHIKSALLEDTDSYIDEIRPFNNRRTVTNSYFRYAKDKKPYYPYSTGDIKTDIALVHKINSEFEGERVVYYKGSEGVIRFTTKSEQATPMSDLLDREETLRELEAERDLAKLDELNKVIKNWHDDYDHIDYENPSNADKLIIAKQKVIKYLQQRLTEKGVDRADIKARISTLESQVNQLEQDQTDKNVEDIIKLTLKSVNNELTNTQAQLDSNPSESTLFSILKRLGEIDIYLEGIRNVDELLFSSSDALKKQYRLLGADVNDARKDYLEQTKDALLQIARKVSYESFQNVDKDILFGSAEDISLVTREVLSAANAKNGVSKLVYDLIKRAEYDIRQKQREISTTIDTKVKELEKHTGKKGKDLMDLFLQRYEDGSYTGNTVGRYKQEFFDERNAIYEKFRLGIIDAKGLRDWYKANQHTITREELESGVSDVFSEEEMLRQKELLERYEQDLEAYKEQIESSFTDTEGNIDNAGMMNAVEEWISIHSPYIYIDSVHGAAKYNKFSQGKNYIIPAKPNKKWEDKAFDKFMKDDKVVDEVLYDFYKFMKETFSENNKLLPYVNRLPGNYLPEIRKSFLERTSDEGVLKGLMSLGEEFRNAITDEVQGMIDYDIELGNRKFKTIPVRMMQNMLQADEKSLDIFRILKLHSAMANSYAYKARVEPLLNASQQVLEEMAEVQMRETIKGKQPVKDQWQQKKLRQAGLVNTRKQLEHTIGAFLYGDYRDIEGRIGKAKFSKKDKEKLANLQEQLDKGEITQEEFDNKSNLVGRQVTVTGIADVLNKYTYLNALGFPNFITPSVNLTFGIASNLIYAAGDRIIDLKSMRKSINMFTKALLGKYTGIDKAHFNKMWAWMEELGVLDDFNESLYGTKKTIADKALFLQNNTERMNRGAMMLSHLLSINVKDKQGNNVPLYYAYNEVDGKLVWNVDKMGEQVETSRQTKITKENEGVNLYTLTRLIERTNQNVHGDYESSLRVKRTVAGRVLGMFKTWMPMSIMYRFGSEYYDEELQRDVKGRYTVLWTAKDLEGNAIKTTDFLKLLARASFKKNGLAGLSETDREAVRRNLKELQFIAQFTIAVLALASIETDDDEERFALNLLINFLTKAQADLSFFTDPSAMAQVVNNVAPVYTTVRNLFSITNVAWETISGSPNYEAGPLKDKNRAVVWSLKNLPLTNPAMRIWNYGDRVVSYF